jgi:hypothetical protein
MPRNKKKAAANRKPASRKAGAKVKGKGKVKTKAAKMVKGKTPPQPQQKSAGSNRAEGVRLFKVAGRPTKEQFVLVYGEQGPKMTWDQRAAAGVPAEKFQAALASAVRGQK